MILTIEFAHGLLGAAQQIADMDTNRRGGCIASRLAAVGVLIHCWRVPDIVASDIHRIVCKKSQV